jgi:hypothetical protein
MCTVHNAFRLVVDRDKFAQCFLKFLVCHLQKRGDQSSDRVAVKPSARSDRKSPVRPAAKVQPISAPTVKR